MKPTLEERLRAKRQFNQLFQVSLERILTVDEASLALLYYKTMFPNYEVWSKAVDKLIVDQWMKEDEPKT